MLIILPEFIVKLEDFSAFKVVNYDPLCWTLQGYTLGEWVVLYKGDKEDTTKKKELLDGAIATIEAHTCKECGESNLICICDKENIQRFLRQYGDFIESVHVEKECEEGHCECKS
jgi:hypothetical protein